MYCCHVCQKRYRRGTYLTEHLKSVHNIKWPSGHTRFRYRRDDDGMFRLQTDRVELSELAGAEEEEEENDEQESEEEEEESVSAT